MAKGFRGEVPDKVMAPLTEFFREARLSLPPWRATTDELLEALTRAALGE